MEFKLTRHHYLDLGEKGIPTADWSQYADDHFLIDGKAQLIAAWKDKKNLFGDPVHQETHYLNSDKLTYIKELERRIGKKAFIIVHEIVDFEASGIICIHAYGYQIVGVLTDSEIGLVEQWVKILTKDYLFDGTNNINLDWIRDRDGNLLINGLNTVEDKSVRKAE